MYAFPAKRMKTFRYGGGVSEELVAQRACHACRNRLSPYFHIQITELVLDKDNIIMSSSEQQTNIISKTGSTVS